MKYFLILITGFCFNISFFLPNRAFSDTYIVNGELTYSYEVYSRNQKLLDQFFEYENESNSQKVIKREAGKITVQNTANLKFFKSTAPFPVNNLYSSNPKFKQYLDLSTTVEGYIIRTVNGKRTKTDFIKKTPLEKNKVLTLNKLAIKIAGDSKYQWEAVEKIVSYIRQNVKYQLGTSPDPIDVLRTGKAYCEGYANLAAMLLQSIGIPSRTVTCYIPAGHMWGLGYKGAGGFHAYIEVYYKDRGWVSYDPQATLHFVDPFHIVKYPRSEMSIRELKTVDTQKILDSKPYPVAWKDFYKRRTESKQFSAIIVGKIINRKKALVKDSYNTGEWVYLKTKTRRDLGIRILSSGYFAIPVYKMEKAVSFYFMDKNGGFVEKDVHFTKKEVKEFVFDLSDSNKTIKMVVPKNRTGLTRWEKGNKNKWALKTYPVNRDGTIVLLLDSGKYIFSQSNNVSKPRYLLSLPEKKKKDMNLDELPLFLDPNEYYAMGKITGETGKPIKANIKLSSSKGRFYPSIPTNANGEYNYNVPDPSFNIVTIEGNGFSGSKKIDFSKAKHIRVNFNLKKDGFTKIITNKKNTRIYFNLKKGNRYINFGEALSNSAGNLYVLFPNGTYHISVGKMFSKKMQKVNIKKGGAIRLK